MKNSCPATIPIKKRQPASDCLFPKRYFLIYPSALTGCSYPFIDPIINPVAKYFFAIQLRNT